MLNGNTKAENTYPAVIEALEKHTITEITGKTHSPTPTVLVFLDENEVDRYRQNIINSLETIRYTIEKDLRKLEDATKKENTICNRMFTSILDKFFETLEQNMDKLNRRYKVHVNLADTKQLLQSEAKHFDHQLINQFANSRRLISNSLINFFITDFTMLFKVQAAFLTQSHVEAKILSQFDKLVKDLRTEEVSMANSLNIFVGRKMNHALETVRNFKLYLSTSMSMSMNDHREFTTYELVINELFNDLIYRIYKLKAVSEYNVMSLFSKNYDKDQRMIHLEMLKLQDRTFGINVSPLSQSTYSALGAYMTNFFDTNIFDSAFRQPAIIQPAQFSSFSNPSVVGPGTLYFFVCGFEFFNKYNFSSFYNLKGFGSSFSNLENQLASSRVEQTVVVEPKIIPPEPILTPTISLSDAVDTGITSLSTHDSVSSDSTGKSGEDESDSVDDLYDDENNLPFELERPLKLSVQDIFKFEHEEHNKPVEPVLAQNHKASLEKMIDLEAIYKTKVDQLLQEKELEQTSTNVNDADHIVSLAAASKDTHLANDFDEPPYEISRSAGISVYLKANNISPVSGSHRKSRSSLRSAI
jgi:hypothetical protein